MSAKDVQEPMQVDADLSKNIGRAVANIQKRHPEKVKTTLCKFFAVGNCQRGDKCTFKHGEDDEGRQPHSPAQASKPEEPQRPRLRSPIPSKDRASSASAAKPAETKARPPTHPPPTRLQSAKRSRSPPILPAKPKGGMAEQRIYPGAKVCHNGQEFVCVSAAPGGPYVWVGGLRGTRHLDPDALQHMHITHLVPAQRFKVPVIHDGVKFFWCDNQCLFDVDRPDYVCDDALSLLCALKHDAANAKHDKREFGVLFFCEAGRHRSLAMAILFIWFVSCSFKSLDDVVNEIMPLDHKFEISQRDIVERGRCHKATGITLRMFEHWYLKALPMAMRPRNA